MDSPISILDKKKKGGGVKIVYLLYFTVHCFTCGFQLNAIWTKYFDIPINYQKFRIDLLQKIYLFDKNINIIIQV